MKEKRFARSGLAVAGVVLASTLAACGSGDGSSRADRIVLADGGGTFGEAAAKAIYEPCGKELGIDVQVVPYDYSVGQIKAQVQGPKEWDVVSLGAFLTDENADSILAPIDTDIVDRSGLDEDLLFDYWVPYDITVIGVGHNTEKLKDAPTTWADLWDVENFPGRGTLEKNAVNYNLELALLADGVAPADMYPIDYDRAFKKLDELFEIRDMMFYDSGTTLVQQYQTATAVIGSGMGGRFLQAAAEGAPVSMSSEGAIQAFTSWAVLKSAPQTKNAMRFINCAISAERQAAFIKEFPGEAPVNADAFELLPAELREALPEPNDPSVLNSSVKYWAEEFDTATERWNQWLAKHGG